MFRKSTRCGSSACVEVDVPEFRKASACAQGTCVEVAQSDVIRVRDGKNPDGPVLAFTPEEWAAFVEGVKSGEFDLPYSV